MKKYSKLSFILIIGLQLINVEASSGRLRNDSIKTCPNGVTYGQHTDHWHIALVNNGFYYASGDPIGSDPCPGQHQNQGTAGATNQNSGSSSPSDNSNNKPGTSTSSSNTYSKPSSSSTPRSNSSSSSAGISNSYVPVPVPDPSSKKEIKKNSDVSIKKITVNGIDINEIKDEMTYEITGDKIDLKVSTNDKKSNSAIEGDLDNLSIDKYNKLKITITAEDGSKKDYYLNLKKKLIQRTPKLLQLKINDSYIDFNSNNKGSYIAFNWEKSFSLEYKLEDAKTSISIYDSSNKKIGFEKNKLKKGLNTYKIKIIDEYGNTNDYILEIDRISMITSIFTMIIGLAILASIPIIVVVIIIYKKKKK